MLYIARFLGSRSSQEPRYSIFTQDHLGWIQVSLHGCTSRNSCKKVQLLLCELYAQLKTWHLSRRISCIFLLALASLAQLHLKDAQCSSLHTRTKSSKQSRSASCLSSRSIERVQSRGLQMRLVQSRCKDRWIQGRTCHLSSGMLEACLVFSSSSFLRTLSLVLTSFPCHVHAAQPRAMPITSCGMQMISAATTAAAMRYGMTSKMMVSTTSLNFLFMIVYFINDIAFQKLLAGIELALRLFHVEHLSKQQTREERLEEHA